MESKGRRTARAGGHTEAAAEPIKVIDAPGAGNFPTESSAEQPLATEIVGEAAEPGETARDPMAAVPMAPVESGTAPIAAGPISDDPARGGNDAFAALAQSQAALTRGLEATSAEMAGLALSGIDNAARTATKMLEVKNLSEAIEVNAGFTCSSWDRLIGSSAKLSELGVKLASEASRPFVTQFGRSWGKTRL